MYNIQDTRRVLLQQQFSSLICICSTDHYADMKSSRTDLATKEGHMFLNGRAEIQNSACKIQPSIVLSILNPNKTAVLALVNTGRKF
jgi:hypothetical protein